MKIALLSIVLAIILGAAISSRPPAQKPVINAKLSSAGAGFGLRITNTDAFAWTKCNAQINPHDSSDGYQYSLGDVPAGQSVTAELIEFTEGDGKRFDPMALKLKRFVLFCQFPNGFAGNEFNWN